MENRYSHSDNAPEIVQPDLEVRPPQSRFYYQKSVSATGSPVDSDDSRYATSSIHSSQPPRRCLGLSPFLSGLLLGLLIALVTAGAIGGGLGASLASCRNTHPDPRLKTARLANFTVPSPAQVTKLKSSCPQQRLVGTPQGDTYTTSCNVDFGNSMPAEGGGRVTDILGLRAWTFTDCLEACSAMNAYNKNHTKPRCAAVTWATDMSNATALFDANCWLKNATAASDSTRVLRTTRMSATLNI